VVYRFQVVIGQAKEFTVAKSELRVWAVKGAEQRLLELAEEAGQIFAAFPELRGRGRDFEAPAGPSRTSGAAGNTGARPASRRRKRSAEARRRMSEAQKARWAKRRAAQGVVSATAESTSAAGARKKK
jgi:hypothetical protein